MAGEVTIRFVDDVGASPETSQPGDAEWATQEDSSFPGKIAGLLFVCPCGCRSLGCLNIIKIDAHPVWSWNGNVERPTLTPSIQKNSPCRWHGYLTDGVFKPC